MDKQELQENYQNLKQVGISPRATQDRGRKFESLVCDLFDLEEILLSRPYYTDDGKSEQIDGAIEILGRVILLEVKWVESNLAASDLYAFLGKVENKLSGTLGLFVSKEKLSANFINSIVKGRSRKILLLHGDDVDLFFDPGIRLKTYLEYVLRRYSYDNIIHYPLKDFQQETLSAQKEVVVPSVGVATFDQAKVSEFLSLVLGKKELESHEILTFSRSMSEGDRVEAVNLLVKMLPEITEVGCRNFLGPLYKRVTNSRKALKLLLEDNVIRETADHYFSCLASTASDSYLINPLWEKYKVLLDQSPRKPEVLRAIGNAFLSVKENWNSENRITEIIDPIWNSFDDDTKSVLFGAYVEIYLDKSRREQFEQKQFATKLVESDFEGKKKEMISHWVKDKIEKEVAQYSLTIENLENEVKLFMGDHRQLLNQVFELEEDAQAMVSETYQTHIGKKKETSGGVRNGRTGGVRGRVKATD